jgi:hypothetical protein
LLGQRYFGWAGRCITDADLSQATLRKATLATAELCGADLGGAEADLNGALWPPDAGNPGGLATRRRLQPVETVRWQLGR